MNFDSILHIVLILLSPLLALMWSVMLLVKKDRLQAHVLMGILLLLFTIAYFLFISYFTPAANMVSGICYMFFALAIPPMHVFFFKIITDPEGIQSKDFILFAPNIAIVLITIILNMIMGRDAADALFHSLILNEPISVPAEYITTTWKVLGFVCYTCFRYLLLSEIVIMTVWAFLRIRKYNLTIDDYYSDTERRGKKQNIIVFCTMMISLFAALGLLAKPFHEIDDNRILFITMSICVSVGIFFTGYYSYQIRFTAEQLAEQIAQKDQQEKEAGTFIQKPDNLPVNEKLYAQCIMRLKELMETQKAYLDPELSLIDVASDIGTNRTYLAQIIHYYYDCSFSDYINLQRIEHSEVMLQNHKELSMLDIATQSGYLTLSSFYRNFQKFTGTTPTKWRAQFNS